MDYHIAVVGSGGGIGETLVRSLTDDSTEVIFLDADRRAVERAAAAGVDARVVDPSEAAALDREDIGEVEIALVASREDGRNLLVSQLLGLRRAERVITLVNDPNNVEAFADAGVEPVCVSTTLATALDRQRRERRTTEASNRTRGESREAEASNGTERTEERTRDEGLRSDGGKRDEGRRGPERSGARRRGERERRGRRGRRGHEQ